jgi:agmatine deiminase
MTKALLESEKVFIIVYDAVEEKRVKSLLSKANASFENIFFYQIPNDDVWIRDNGPIYVRDNT